MAVQLMKGHRWGDHWSHTRVVWTKYADHPIFHVPVQASDESGALGEPPPKPESYTPDDAEQDDNPYRAPRF